MSIILTQLQHNTEKSCANYNCHLAVHDAEIEHGSISQSQAQ